MTMMISEVYEAFRAVDIPEDKAAAAAKVIAHKDSMATKDDLLRLEIKLDKKLEEVRSELKEEMAGLRVDILKFQNKILVWMGGMFVVAVSILATLIKIL